MKFKTTAKAIKEGFSYLYSVGYCQAPYLFRGVNPVAYTAGVYGWNCDVYMFDNVGITAGYRTTGARIDDAIIKRYDNKARRFFEEFNVGAVTYDEYHEKVIRNIYRMISELVYTE